MQYIAYFKNVTWTTGSYNTFLFISQVSSWILFFFLTFAYFGIKKVHRCKKIKTNVLERIDVHKKKIHLSFFSWTNIIFLYYYLKIMTFLLTVQFFYKLDELEVAHFV